MEIKKLNLKPHESSLDWPQKIYSKDFDKLRLDTTFFKPGTHLEVVKYLYTNSNQQKYLSEGEIILVVRSERQRGLIHVQRKKSEWEDGLQPIKQKQFHKLKIVNNQFKVKPEFIQSLDNKNIEELTASQSLFGNHNKINRPDKRVAEAIQNTYSEKESMLASENMIAINFDTDNSGESTEPESTTSTKDVHQSTTTSSEEKESEVILYKGENIVQVVYNLQMEKKQLQDSLVQQRKEYANLLDNYQHTIHQHQDTVHELVTSKEKIKAENFTIQMDNEQLQSKVNQAANEKEQWINQYSQYYANKDKELQKLRMKTQNLMSQINTLKKNKHTY